MSRKDVFKKIIVENIDKGFFAVQRELKLPTNLDLVVSLYGPRRSGKTYLFYQTIKNMLKNADSLNSILYVNFEDERILPFTKEDWDLLLDAYFELYPENLNQTVYLFFDEVQEIPLWEKFVRRLSEKKKFNIFLTGSSSRLFSQEIATSLRGRTLSFFLMPFSFKEFLAFKKFEIGEHLEYSPKRHKAKKLFLEYLKYGGFPEVLDKKEPFKTQILQGYFDLIFYKDIVERYNIRNFNLMKNLMRYMISHCSSLFSLTAYYNFLKSQGEKIGKDTLFEYLSLLEEVNFVRMVPIFDSSLKKQMVNPKKLYCIDTGLITAASFQFSSNRGKYLENIAFLELMRRGKDIFYYKGAKDAEVDFLITEKNKPNQLIQVCADMDKPGTREKEISSLVCASRQFNIKQCLILTEDQTGEIVEGKLKIEIVPLWQWLLELPKRQAVRK
ncbi:MAG: ATP-binding protein [Candidatus Omnitrophota bacterium]